MTRLCNRHVRRGFNQDILTTRFVTDMLGVDSAKTYFELGFVTDMLGVVSAKTYLRLGFVTDMLGVVSAKTYLRLGFVTDMLGVVSANAEAILTRQSNVQR